MWRARVPASKRRRLTFEPMSRARCLSSSMSPIQTRSQGNASRATARHSSGPMPAGSPQVSAIRGMSDFKFDVGFIAQTSQPQLRLFVRLARANLLCRALALQLIRVVELAPAKKLHDVPAELRLEGLADLLFLQARDRLLELGHEGSRTRPAQIPALGRRARVLRVAVGETCEVLAFEHARAQLSELLPNGRIVSELVGLHQYMPHVHLAYDHLLVGAAQLV